ncbi:nitroreductase family deazaflavin-dependent oxidoreductase [Actinomadura roseirufa]|uniref:nitroreductase family deazaflavin-dependent oxidoreductase n=1 Tax=Actinomadura roseirufa TaxID=2094049 RepID=UPI0010411DAA|nr:nitroreductase family deazaflavin-dependent oxidoreductase [Actinomadura roseirufa]
MPKPLLPRSLARFNRRVTNRIQGPYAAYLPPLAVIVHRGRRSGREYRTPVTAFRSGGRLVVGLPYGPGTDWVRNLLAADGGGVERAGRARRIRRPRVVRGAAAADLPAPMRFAARHVDLLVADIDD